MGVTRKAKGAEPKGQRKDDKSSNPDSLAAAGSRLAEQKSRKPENPDLLGSLLFVRQLSVFREPPMGAGFEATAQPVPARHVSSPV